MNLGPEHAALALNCEQTGELLSRYKNGILEKGPSRAVEMHIATCAECSRELKLLRAEDDLLREALFDIRPSISYRSRVSQLCSDALMHAEKVANSVPEKSWATVRWGLALMAVLHFALISFILDPNPAISTPSLLGAGDTGEQLAEATFSLEGLSSSFWSVIEARSSLYWIILTFFLFSLFLLIGGRLLAQLENRLTSSWGEPSRDAPSRLEVLTLEVLGICGVVATSAFHYYLQYSG